jgi:hypothetical protein
MPSDRMSFGEHLRQFALSIDFIDQTHYILVQQQIEKYLRIQLGATQVALFKPETVDDREGMTTVWSEPNFCIHQTLREDGQEKGKTGTPGYRRQLAMAIGEQRNLWVISEDSHLGPGNPGVDVWGKERRTDLPNFYVAANAKPSKTQVVLITKDAQSQSNGAFLIEMSKVIRPSIVLRREMQLIADAIGLLHATDASTREQREGTAQAIDNLSDLVGRLELDTGARPMMFIASSSRASKDVMKAIEKVLEGFDEHIFVEPWDKAHMPGNINVQLVDKIRKSQYGICYLSEPAERKSRYVSGKHRYQDNANVLVEAGMLHIVTAVDAGSGTGWIPIREKDSPDAPFDLGNQRMVFVERDMHGKVNIEELTKDLTDKLNALLGVDVRELNKISKSASN